MTPLPLHYAEVSPAPPLRPWVECYWTSAGRLAEPCWKSVLPDGCMDLIFADVESEAQVVGTQRQAMPVRLVGTVTLFGIRFRPGSLPSFFPVDATTLVDRSGPLSELLPGPLLRDFHELLGAPLAERVALADRMLLGRLAGLVPDRFVARAVAALARSRTTPGTETLADRLGMSRRTLERRFQATVGVGPGTLARILRFRRAVDRMAGRPDLALGRIAHESGYADQPHFTREVRSFTGLTPGRLRITQWGG